MVDEYRLEWVAMAARQAAAERGLPVASFSALSRTWAARLRTRLTEYDVAVVDFKPLLTSDELPPVGAFILTPGAPVNRALYEAALQDVPVIIGDNRMHISRSLVSAQVRPSKAPERRHIAIGEIQIMPDSSRSTLGVTVNGRHLGDSLATALSIQLTWASIVAVSSGSSTPTRSRWPGRCFPAGGSAGVGACGAC